MDLGRSGEKCTNSGYFLKKKMIEFADDFNMEGDRHCCLQDFCPEYPD